MPQKEELEPPTAAAAAGAIPEEEADELIGRTIGSYVITRPLGKGGMGAVYAAEHPVIGSRVAIKFLHPQFSNDKKIVDRFFNEARAVNVIGHDNILKILDLNVTEDNRHYFIMEFLVGQPLQKLVEEGVPVPLEVAGPILLQFCEALQAAHERGIFHRDIKPDNVYLIVHKGRKNFVKVVDFGIAKLTGGDGQSTGKTQTGMVMGTPAYMAPEQAGGMTSQIDCRSDIYSAGVMMFQLATGQLPFPGESFGEVLIGHLQVPPPPPRSLCAGIPEEYQAVILRALAKKREDRQQSMRELHDEIQAVMDSLGVSAELPRAEEKDLPGPPSTTSALKLKALQTRAGQRATGAGRPASQPGRATPTPVRQGTVALAPPPRSNLPLYAGIAAAALVLVGGSIAFAMHQAQKRAELAEAQAAAERAAAAAREEMARVAAKAEAERKAEEERRRREQETAPQKLTVISDPLGASVQAEWKLEGADNSRQGTTPFDFTVPRNTRVKLAFTRQGFLAWSTEVVVSEARSVTAKLEPDPRLAEKARPKPPRKKGKAGARDEEDPEVFKVDF